MSLTANKRGMNGVLDLAPIIAKGLVLHYFIVVVVLLLLILNNINTL
jgi:hypothetical protein